MNCSCYFIITSKWRIFKINDTLYTEITLQSNPTATTSNLILSNRMLKYGLYKVEYNINIKVNNPIRINSTQDLYIKIIPTGFIVSAFDNGISVNNKLTVGILDTISFIPAFYSYDLDNLTESSSLDYNFYCILRNNNSILTNDFNQNLYQLKPNVELTQEQLNSPTNCFTSTGLTISLKFKFV